MFISKSSLLFVVLLLNFDSASFDSRRAVVEFESALSEIDCASVAEKSAFELRVLGHSFPLSSGYNYYGEEFGVATFRKIPNMRPLEYLKLHPDARATDVATALSAMRVSITLTHKSKIDVGELTSGGFAIHSRNDLTFHIRATSDRHAHETVEYQVIVHSKRFDGELKMTASDRSEIVAVVACAKKIAE